MIEIWSNKITGHPSIQAGNITMDLGEETPAQATLFREVMNHPEAVAAGAVRAPLTTGIVAALELVIDEHLRKMLPPPTGKRVGHVVEIEVE